MPDAQHPPGEPAGPLAASRSQVELLPDAERPGAWMLLIDDVPQSYVDLGDPRHLELEYTQWIGHLIDLAGPAGAPLRVLHLGAGGLTLARYVAATRPGSHQLAVEADPRVAQLIWRRLPLRDAGGRGCGQVTVLVADARAVAERQPAGSWDLVIADAFTGAATPPRAASAEFAALLARALTPAGICAVNVGDGPPLAHARGRAAAVRAAFPHHCLIAEPPVLAGQAFGNLVLAASGWPLPVAELARRAAAGPAAALVAAGAALDDFTAGARPVTDAHPGPPPPPLPEVYD
ncbi:MAG: spermidine synthase [Streptosporangiaceae bacterium]